MQNLALHWLIGVAGYPTTTTATPLSRRRRESSLHIRQYQSLTPSLLVEILALE